MAKSPAERAAIDADYEERLAAGPEFTRYHASSAYAEPPHEAMTVGDRNTVLRAFDYVERGVYQHCRAKRGQGISTRYRSVLSALLAFAVRYGRVYPRLETIARMASVCRRTVINALCWLEAFGFQKRIRRLAMQASRFGRRRRQTSNAYRLFCPRHPPHWIAQIVFRHCQRQPLALHQEKPRIIAPNTAGGRSDMRRSRP